MPGATVMSASTQLAAESDANETEPTSTEDKVDKKKPSLPWLVPLVDAFGLTNKAVEICVTLLVVFLLIELSIVPDGCSPGTYADCMSIYLQFASANEDFAVLSCAEAKEKCFKSSVGALLGKPQLTTNEALVNSSFYGFLQLCRCLNGPENSSDDVFCDLFTERVQFFWLGIAVVYFFEATARASKIRYLRFLVYGLGPAYFIAATMVFSEDKCQSIDYQQKIKIVSDLSWASVAVILVLQLLELFVFYQARKTKVEPEPESEPEPRRASKGDGTRRVSKTKVVSANPVDAGDEV